MPTFDNHRDRVPTSLFKDIVSDLQVFMESLFVIRMWKLGPDSLLHYPIGHMTTRERIKHHFSVFGRTSVLVMEMKIVLGTSDERFDAIAVIAECDTCDYATDRLDLPSSPIYGILCDGTSFSFFSFDGSATPSIFSHDY